MNTKTFFAAATVAAFALGAAAGEADGETAEMGGRPALEFDAGADLRVRQEIMDNVAGLPGGGLHFRTPRGPYRNQMRFRVRAWGELKAGDTWRAYLRLADEFRWNVRPKNKSTSFPDELIIDNLFIEGKGLFDGFMDVKIGRQDLYRNMYGLDNLFIDGTPGDGSRSVYTDMVKTDLHLTEDGTLSLFMLHNWDESPVRWGTHRSRHRSLSGLGGTSDLSMDDWGWGGIWSSKAGDALPYQIFAMQKITESFRRGGTKIPHARRELLGAKVVPQLTEEVSLQLEAMGQVGRDGNGAWLSGWSTYSGVKWAKKRESGVAPFASAALHVMSGDKNAANENGGRHAWDPMWSRGVNDSESMLYGTHYGTAWWSNMAFLRFECGLDFGRSHKLSLLSGPMFAMADDGLGGDDGHFKGYLNRVRYDFPLMLADKGKGERLEIVGQLLAELFNPGDYFETDKPDWFLRWQVEVRF